MEMQQVQEWVEAGPSPILTSPPPDAIHATKPSSELGTDSPRSTRSRQSLARSSSSLVKRIVSKNHRRFVNDDFDLDLSYISDCIISTSYPAVGAACLFRNSLKDLSRFLTTYHQNRYKVYNLCSEILYDTSLLEGQVVRYPCDDMQPPPLEIMYQFCEDATSWIQLDPDNVVVVHCQAGKGRTGVMVCCLLLFMGRCDTASEAVEMFAQMRTNDGKGITIPSQIRYIQYFHMLLKNLTTYNLQGLTVTQIRLVNMGAVLKRTGLRGLILAISNRNAQTSMRTLPVATVKLPSYKLLSCGELVNKGDGYQFMLDDQDIIVTFDQTEFPLVCRGDVKVQVFKGIPSKKNSMFYLWFNAGVEGVEEQMLTYRTKDLDKPSVATKHNLLAVQISTVPVLNESDEMERVLSEKISDCSIFDDNTSFTIQAVEDVFPSRKSSFDALPDVPFPYQQYALKRAQSSMSSVSLKSLSEDAMSMHPHLFGKANPVKQEVTNGHIGGHIRTMSEDELALSQEEVVDGIVSTLERKWFTNVQ